MALHERFRASLKNNMPSFDAGTRSHINDVIGGEDGFRIVLHHQDSISEVPEAPQVFQQTPIVPVVEADTGFIQNVKDARQTRTDLGGQSDALILPPRKGGRRPVQGEVIQSDTPEKPQTLLDLPENPISDGCFLLGEFQIVKESCRFFDGKAGDVLYGLAVNRHR